MRCTVPYIGASVHGAPNCAMENHLIDHPEHPWAARQSDIGLIALVGSAGALQSFRTILRALPPHFSIPVLVCQHRMTRNSPRDILVQILQSACSLPVMQACDDMLLAGGMAYVAPPDRQLTVINRRTSVRESRPTDNFRPSFNLLFESLAADYGSRLIVVVLSGSLNDGAVGVVKVKANGGRVIVQDPDGASHRGMANAAISTGCADFVLPLENIASALTAIAMVPGATDLFTATSPAWTGRRRSV